MIEDLLARVQPFQVGLTAQFRSVNHRVGFVIRGKYGIGEWAPFADYEPAAAAKWLAAALEAADQPRSQLNRSEIAANGIVPALAPAAAVTWAGNLINKYQVNTLKIKVGDDEQLDRVRAIRAEFPAATIRVDANGSYSETEAAELIREFAALDVAVIEQPCATLAECKAVKGNGVLIAVDESIRLAANITDELLDQLRAAADIAVLKPIPLGGSKPTLNLAARLDLPVIISGSLDTSIGLSFVAYVAALLPTEPLPSGLGTSVLLEHDLVKTSLLPKHGAITISEPVLDEQLLAEATARASSVELAELTQRLIAAAKYLEEVPI